jgi:hypothetical protein
MPGAGSDTLVPGRELKNLPDILSEKKEAAGSEFGFRQ